MAVNAGLFVDELLHKTWRSDDNTGCWPELEREDASILLGPFCESFPR